MPPDSPRDDRAREWLERGSFYSWAPAAGPAAGREVEIFHIEAGRSDSPALLLVHGFPTSSIDWYDVIDELAGTYRVSAIDFPGYGFSAKPRDWPYSLQTDADLLAHHVTNVVGAASCRIVAHDRGDSVALILSDRARRGAADSTFGIDHLLLSNGNIFLPLASLTTFQKMILDADRAGEVLAMLTPEMLAAGMGSSTFTPPRAPDDPTVRALASAFAHNDGISVLHDTVQYLRERADQEADWLGSVSRSEVPATLVWGLCDTVSPPRVAMHVWENFLRTKPGSNELWFIPDANHYLQNDRPAQFAEVVLRSLDRSGPAEPGPVAQDPGSPIRVDQSSAQLRDPAETFAL